MRYARASLGRTAFRILAPSAVLTVSAASLVWAGGRFVPPVKDPVVAKECSACHMAYPAGFLSAASWSAIVAGLDNHFGENASVDAATAAALKAYLSTNAERGDTRSPKTGTAALRITELDWFLKRHGKNRLSPERLQRKGAKSAAQCNACHKQAEQGYYED